MGERSWPRRQSPHMILCAALGRGHLTPMIGLAQALAATSQVSITLIFQNRATLNSIQKSIFSGLDVQFAVLDESDRDEDPPWMIRLPVRVRMTRKSPAGSENAVPIEFPSQESALEALLADFLASPSPPICLVNDFTISWAAAPARNLNLPRYVLYTDPASFMAVAYYCEILVKRGILPVTDPSQTFTVPGLPALYQQDITQFVWDSTEPYFPMQNLWHQHTLQSDGVLLNTYYEFESSAVDALRSEILAETSLFTVGPLITSVSDVERSTRCAVFTSPQNPCIEWLDSKPESSVLYLSFGSWEFLPDEQITELATGLESSGCCFLWVLILAPESSLESLLPEGFNANGRGLIITTWAPQRAILEHPAVGAFLTHCGWNSVLECVCIAGVPMICWPFLADQPTTSRFLVDGLKIAIEIHEDGNSFVDRAEIEAAVRKVMKGGKAEEMRGIAMELKRLAAKALDPEEGSSRISLQSFIRTCKCKPTEINPC